MKQLRQTIAIAAQLLSQFLYSHTKNKPLCSYPCLLTIQRSLASLYLAVQCGLLTLYISKSPPLDNISFNPSSSFPPSLFPYAFVSHFILMYF